MIKFYNSLTKKKEILKTKEPNKIGIYLCGITSYADAHIGHARTFVTFDAIFRFLENQGYQLKYVRNITDIDDKIISEAKKKSEEVFQFSSRCIASFQEDCQALRLLVPTFEVRVTQAIDTIIKYIERLLSNNAAYCGQNGDIFFSVSRLKNYGELSHRDSEAEKKIRIKSDPNKRDQDDFVLWKLTKNDQEPSFHSPWGAGRPGWHTECVAIATKYLGADFDFHCGGIDLKFPHHENERAQALALQSKKFAKYWLHSGHVNLKREKMSKSLGNTITIKEILQEVSGDCLRFYLLQTHYRSPLEHTKKSLQAAERAYKKLCSYAEDDADKKEDFQLASEVEKPFTAALSDDFNSPEAIAYLFYLGKKIRESGSKEKRELAFSIRTLGAQIGLSFQTKSHNQSSETKKWIEKMIQERNSARENGNWKKADEIRSYLNKNKIQLQDGPEGTTWRQN